MTTFAPPAAILAQDTDANFIAWVSDLFNALTNGAFSLGGTAFGTFQQTADTGQLTPAVLASATRPAVNTALGYIVCALTDANAGSAPVYVKVEVGSGTSTVMPNIWVTVGASTNGAGTLSNLYFARTAYPVSPTTTTTAYGSYACAVDGFFGLIFKNTGFANYAFRLILARTTGPSGAATADGIVIMTGMVGAPATVAVGRCTGTAVVSSSTPYYAMIPCGITASAVGGVAQVFPFVVCLPAAFTVLPLAVVLNSEISNAATFTATVAGSTSRTYKAFATGNTYGANGASGTNLAMLWE